MNLPEAAFETILLTQDAGVATITINTPPANTLSAKTMGELSRAFDAIEGDEGVRAVVVTGAGPSVFAGGADVNEFTRIATEDEARTKMRAGAGLFRRIELFAKPVIAAVNGVCAGGGCELALACDIRVMAESARIGQPEITLGIMPAWGGTQRLPQLVGRANALLLMMSGEMIGAVEAARIGLVNLIVADGQALSKATELAGVFARQAPLALGAIKRAVAAGLDGGYSAGIEREQDEMAALFAGADAREGIAAYLGKRPPEFRGE
ncbi:MAG TPA: enoyl-CoA hydratase-related protein [Candidatus Dormibacteraeota bacterium]|nr:enoyl-CoA hydratase-related protein [Candidatus Dormibacteraeota bacterium]